jgi:Mlc titration factor MtfA (ptsG expression regulator)
MPYALVAGAATLVAAWILLFPRFLRHRRERLARRPFPAEWRAILRARVPLARRLPADLQRQLKERIQVFVHENSFVGCDGLAVTDEMRVTVAAHACLLLLNRPGRHFSRLTQILVYPGPFVVTRERRDPLGLVREESRVHLGESSTQGQVVLSWPDVLAGAADPDDGHNVALHEFAHQLDQEKGFANGAPDLVDARRYGPWSRVLGREFALLREALARGEAPLIPPYAATDPAEFFAVCTETFFERPVELAATHPELYGELSRYFRVDPRSW